MLRSGYRSSMTAVRSRSTHSPNCFGVAKFSETGKPLLRISPFSFASRSRPAGSSSVKLARRHRLLAVLLEPGLRRDEFFRNFLWHPAVALAQQTDEIRPAVFDLRQAQGQDLPFGLGFVGDTPAQVHLAPGYAAALAQAAQLGEDLLHQF